MLDKSKLTGADISIAVSYTHLISAKATRMQHLKRLTLFWKGNTGPSTLSTLTSVSYTHLDVYKRQVDYNHYQGMVVSHKVQHVFLRGQKIIEDGAFTTDVPTGNYLLLSLIHISAYRNYSWNYKRISYQ